MQGKGGIAGNMSMQQQHNSMQQQGGFRQQQNMQQQHNNLQQQHNMQQQPSTSASNTASGGVFSTASSQYSYFPLIIT